MNRLASDVLLEMSDALIDTLPSSWMPDEPTIDRLEAYLDATVDLVSDMCGVSESKARKFVEKALEEMSSRGLVESCPEEGTDEQLHEWLETALDKDLAGEIVTLAMNVLAK